MFNAEKIKLIVSEKLPSATVTVRDMTGTNDHFEMVVVSAEFEGKSQVDRHRMVYGALGQTVGNEIHALTFKALTPEEAKK